MSSAYQLPTAWHEDDLEVSWSQPQYARKDVDRAGEALIKPVIAREDYERALEVMNNWRSSHSYPLQALKMALKNRARRVHDKVVVAQRLKRLSSITVKLGRNDNMKLSQMQDIGGCRAVLPSIRDLNALVEMYEESFAKNPTARSELVKIYDYVRSPKPDGYRSIHLIYKYRSKTQQYQMYNGLRIEIQLRTQLQHAWATAVETVSTFTGQALKVNVGTPQWRRFFALMGSAIARRERRPIVPGTPIRAKESLHELRRLARELNAKTVLQGWNTALTMASSGDYAKAHVFLLVLDTKQLTIRVTGYDHKDLPKASADYLKLETENQLHPERQTVLVSVDSIEALQAAYPNYYMDTAAFLDALTRAVS